MRWWKLRGVEVQVFKDRMLGEGPWEEGEDANDIWLKMATCVQKMAAEVFGVSRGGKQEAKDNWWWSEEVQKAIKEKGVFQATPPRQECNQHRELQNSKEGCKASCECSQGPGVR
jgi:hypothetical protein